MNSELFIIFIIFTTFIILCQTTGDIPTLKEPIKIPYFENGNKTCLIAQFGAQFEVVSNQTSANKSKEVITIHANAAVFLNESYCNGSTARIVLQWGNDVTRKIITQFFIRKSGKNFVLDEIIIKIVNQTSFSFPNISLFEVPTKYGYKCSAVENFQRSNTAGNKLTVIMKNAHWEVFKEMDTSDKFTQTPVNCHDDISLSTGQLVVVVIALPCITVVVVVFFVVFRIKKRGTFV